MRTYNDDRFRTVNRALLVAMLTKLGKDFSTCEQCNEHIPAGKWKTHHTKYEKSTIYDLQIVCQRCNLKPENKGLK